MTGWELLMKGICQVNLYFVDTHLIRLDGTFALLTVSIAVVVSLPIHLIVPQLVRTLD